MKKYRVLVNNDIVAFNVTLADTFVSRLVGLLKHKKLEDGEGLLINRCKQVHTFGMKFSIDALFLSRDGEILHIEDDIRPGRVSRHIKKAHQVLELKAGTVKENNIKPHNSVTFEVIQFRA